MTQLDWIVWIGVALTNSAAKEIVYYMMMILAPTRDPEKRKQVAGRAFFWDLMLIAGLLGYFRAF